MIKLFLFPLVLLFFNFSYAGNDIDKQKEAIIQASMAYVAKSSSKLDSLYKSNPESIVINYWYSILSISNNELSPAINFLHTHQPSYYTKSIRLQLLQEYSNRKSWQNYLTIATNHYDELPESDKCSFQLADFYVNNKKDDNYLLSIVKTHPVSDCLELVKSAMAPDSTAFRLMLSNLILDNKIEMFNSITSEYDIPNTINRDDFKRAVKEKDIFSISYYFSNKIKNNIDVLNDYNSLPDDLPNNFKLFLQNYLSFHYAVKLNFTTALLFTDNNNSIFMSDEQYEWKIRTYLFAKNNKEALQAISNLPEHLKIKSAWIFWKAYLLLQKSNKADSLNNIKSLIKTIDENDLFYYIQGQILLAKIEHRTFNSLPVVSHKFSSSCIYDEDIDNAINLYQIAKTNDDYNLMQLSLYVMQYHATHNLTKEQMLKLSQQLHDLQIYDISIFLAVKSGNTFDWDLTFPTPFYNNYKKYATSNNLEVNYLMAVSRQESKFNPKVIAFDGGIGLMQLMPYTAAEISKKTGFESCIYELDCNIKYGAWYLSYISKDFNGNLIYTSSAYNAGPSKVKNWYKNLIPIADKYPENIANLIQMELIPSKITRNYVQKVLTNKFIYEHITK
jgi:hypothetical protein